MFQTFEVTSSPETGPTRLTALRAEMLVRKIDGFLVPRADRFQGEYVAPCDDRLAWLTGFTGSAGFACVLADVAGVFIDGRYRVQVHSQVADVFAPVHWPETQLADWLKDQSGISKLAFDPWLHTMAQIEALQIGLSGTGIALVPMDNLVDVIWSDRPTPPLAPFIDYSDDMAGETSRSKITRLAAELRDAGQAAAFITSPDSVAWLLNIRGTDIARNPVPHAMALLKSDADVALFCEQSQAADLTLNENVTVVAAGQMVATLVATTGPIRLDPDRAPFAIQEALAHDKIIVGQDPCVLPKARKTSAEIKGARDAHLRDGAAMVRFLAWLDGEAPKGGLTEIDVVTALEGFRRDTNALRDISFETICGAGPNGAIVHYRVNEDTNRSVNLGELLLVDSGGQYLDGTTDITRTITIGDVGPTEKACYTRVLQGMIAISRARFPYFKSGGVAGSDLDALARYPLWLAGLDYDHGTGHGVGAYLSVHEGPQGLSRRAKTALEVGMILSNEPGYYREGAFGIRIENLIVVTAANAITGGDARDMLDFETLTFVPLDRRLIDVTLLSSDERAWIDRYHSDTLKKIGPRVDGAALDWLIAACAPL
ncbi:putative Xaa-Pro aminopeptidase [Octadecabacter antarcticus 307]|uniref:Putative Xaa-Pro aminopeptidase n=1 Tax=Octadecabacter antarcticus 307 TaxID=391626 RepID=M9RAW1_9RHOB|nr:aminopeptidase P family protein [Octadecabacter antarcticus]AGI66915.1 putative Xaa-Pro aminopeptidase [Octadecabacter antarcticus 307]